MIDYRSRGGGENKKERDEKSSAPEQRFDPTGMFHWCPAKNIEECIIVRIFYSPFSRLVQYDSLAALTDMCGMEVATLPPNT